MVPEAGAIRAAVEVARTAVAETATQAAAMETVAVAEAVTVAGVATVEAAEDASGSRPGATQTEAAQLVFQMRVDVVRLDWQRQAGGEHNGHSGS
jgi:hypothetical protein